MTDPTGKLTNGRTKLASVFNRILARDAVICGNSLASQKINRISSGIGLRESLQCTGEGKALIALRPPN